MPASNATLARYIVYITRRLKVNSVRQYMSVIESALPNPFIDNWFLASLLQGIRKDKGDAVVKKLPVTPTLLLKLKGAINLQDPDDVVFWAASLTMFFAFLRKSNVFPPSSKGFDSRRHLRRQDFILTEPPLPTGLLLNIRSSKTLKFLERVLQCPLPFMPLHPLCPLSALSGAFRATSGAAESGPAFVLSFGNSFRPLLYNEFLNWFKQKLNVIGLDSKLYAAHSFRRGGASWALQQGLPGELIQLLGDWKSSAYLGYLEMPMAVKFDALASFAANLPASC